MVKIAEVKLVAIREGHYSVYVFFNLINSEYIMCTRLPNWQVPSISIGDIGFLQYQTVTAGEEYFNVETQQTTKYLYSNVYFINFILKNESLQNNEIIL